MYSTCVYTQTTHIYAYTYVHTHIYMMREGEWMDKYTIKLHVSGIVENNHLNSRFKWCWMRECLQIAESLRTRGPDGMGWIGVNFFEEEINKMCGEDKKRGERRLEKGEWDGDEQRDNQKLKCSVFNLFNVRHPSVAVLIYSIQSL